MGEIRYEVVLHRRRVRAAPVPPVRAEALKSNEASDRLEKSNDAVMRHRYPSSRAKAKTFVLAMIVCFFLLLLASSVGAQHLTVSGVLIGGTVYFATVAVIVMIVRSNFIEVADEQLICHQFPYTFRVPIDRIIEIGVPKQGRVARTLNSFVYVWYDDPKEPGLDRYIRIKQGQYDETTIARVAVGVKVVNNNVKIDPSFEEMNRGEASRS